MFGRSPGTRQGAGRRALALLSIAFFLAGVAYGLVAARAGLFPLPELRRLRAYVQSLLAPPQASLPPGRWHLADERAAALTDEQREEIERLATLGYVSGSRPAGATTGITVHDETRAHAGFNFLTSGHAPEAVLMDMNGNVLHEWTRSFESVWPGRDIGPKEYNNEFWRRSHLLENGDILAIHEGLGLVRLDRDSQVVWRYDGPCHHDLFVADDGSIYTLEREPKILPRIDAEMPVLEEFITILSEDGGVLRRVSLLGALERSPYAPLMSRMPEAGDIIHANTIELLDGRLAARSPAFREGNVLVSIRSLDAIAVVDVEAETVVWALAGLWRQQHQPTVLDNGRLLVFDNEFDNAAGERVSRVIEVDPFSQEIHWAYEGGPSAPFYTPTCGSNQRLPNGNTLITESDTGRAFEVTPDGTIVWEFINPSRAGEDDELIATLFEVIRLSPDFPLEWLTEHPWRSTTSTRF